MVHALKGKEYVEWDNPYDVGMTGLIGFSSGYYAMNDCDALLMLGTDFPYRQFYPQGTARIAQVDIRPEQLGRRAPINLGLVGDVGATLRCFASAVGGETGSRAPRSSRRALQKSATWSRRTGGR